MHGISSIFEFEGKRFRVLRPAKTPDGQPLFGEVWCIDIDNPLAWPIVFSVEEISAYPSSDFEFSIRHDLSAVEQELQDRAFSFIDRLRKEHPDELFYPAFRKAAIAQFIKTLQAEAKAAADLGLQKDVCVEASLYKWLRRYWQRGQRPAALAPDYPKCGKAKGQQGSEHGDSLTARRGRPSARGVPIYQLQLVDRDNFRWAIEKFRAKDERLSLPATYAQLVQERYSFLDGNGDRFDLPEGERPSLKQLRTYYLSNYTHDVRVIHRVGARERNLNLRPKTGSVMTISHGPGHQFEVDATVMEVYAVTRTKKKVIVGKPTLYLVVDRWSRLIVGYYLGFEKPSWISAMQAILSLAEDKQQLCLRYGVTYDEKDWPAHGRFPEEFKADRGSDWMAKDSRNIVENLGPTVENLPAGRAEMKPIVENAINLILREYRKFEKASDPDANQRKRQKRNYKRFASANINQLHKFTLEAIIKLNKTQYPEFPMSLDMLADNLRPMPRLLWQYGVAKTGLPRHYSEEVVRLALLPRRRDVSVNEHGIHLKRCSYWSQEAADARWFDIGYGNTFKVTVSFDPRCVDRIYVYWPNDPNGKPFVAYLSERSAEFAGLSFKEVEVLKKLGSDIKGRAIAENLQEETTLLDKVLPVTEQARKEMEAETRGASMASRTKHAPEEWELALAEERRARQLVIENSEVTETVPPALASSPVPAPAPAPQAVVLRVVSPTPPAQQVKPEHPAAVTAPTAAPSKPATLSMAERVAALKAKILPQSAGK